jgi:putative PIN family toxin of toxin-antitoxin system
MPSVVIDTSTLVGAALKRRSNPRLAFEFAIARYTLIVSPAVLREVEEVLTRPKFDRFVPLDIRAEFILLVRHYAIPHDPVEQIRACRDPKDDMYLSLAVSAGADCIVSSDDDLLCLSPFRGIPILTPRAFLDAAGPA